MSVSELQLQILIHLPTTLNVQDNSGCCNSPKENTYMLFYKVGNTYLNLQMSDMNHKCDYLTLIFLPEL